MNKIEKIISELTFEEKINLIHGYKYWQFNSYNKDINPVICTDGPNGIRKQDNYGGNPLISGVHNVLATTYPTGSTFACFFDCKLISRMGRSLANEFQYYKVNMILGPAACIKRNPLCGRNFEYLSEDPLLSGYIAGNYIKGVESTGCATSLKHYVANNQEYGRQVNSSTLSIKCLRDIYTKGFEIATRVGNPASIMVSYNKINGVYACENRYIMEDVLRTECNYKGIFISDWTAVNDPIASIKAGLNVEMPERIYTKGMYLNAYKNKKLNNADLKNVLKYYIPFIDKYSKNFNVTNLDFEKHFKVAQEVAENSIVLAKNDKNFFPLNKEEEIIILGLRARKMIYLGGGSSITNSYHKPDFIKVMDESKTHYKYFECYDENDELDLSILNGIISQKILVFLGTNEASESEGYDHKDMKLPSNQLQLMTELSKITKNVGVVVESGSVVELPFIDDVQGLFIPYYAGEAEDYALYNLIYGKVNPSGKLAETWIKKYEDCPSSTSYDRDIFNTYYDEDIYIGYRYYDKYKVDVNFAFGHGLCYSEFKLKLLRVVVNQTEIKCEIEITNISESKGKEVIELYIGKKDSNIYRPIKELVAFSKVEVFPHHKKRIFLFINILDLRVFNPSTSKLTLEDGDYELYLGNSSRGDFLTTTINLNGEKISHYELIGPDHSLVNKESKDINILVSTVINTPTMKKILNEAGISKEKLGNTMFKDGFLKNPLRCLAGLGIIEYHTVENSLAKILKEIDKQK